MSEQATTTEDKVAAVAKPIIGIAFTVGLLFIGLYALKTISVRVARTIK